jgi:hypothetical protein
MSEYHAGDGTGGDPSVVAQAQEKVQQTAQQASGTAARYAREQVQTRASQASEELRTVSGAMQRSVHSLRADGKEPHAKAVEGVTHGVDRLAGYLGDTSPDTMLRDVERFGRRQPWGMVGIGLGLGLVASRFLKASSRRRFEEDTIEGRPQFAPPARRLEPMFPEAPAVAATPVSTAVAASRAQGQ